MRATLLVLIGFFLVALILLSCGDGESADDYADYEVIDVSVCAADAGPFTLDIDNAFFPLPTGGSWDLQGEQSDQQVRVVIRVLAETELVGSVETRVVEEREWENGELVEVSRNYFAQAPDGTVCYFGEWVDEYDDGRIDSHAGSWRADAGGNAPGIIMPAEPRAGTKFQQEVAPGVAEDWCALTELGRAITTPVGRFTDTLRAFDWNALEGSDGDVKYYVRDVGIAVDEGLKLTAY